MSKRIPPEERDPRRLFTKEEKDQNAFVNDWECGICLNPVDPEKFNGDHVTPHSHGGQTTDDNLQPAHPKCDNTKRDNDDYHPIDNESVAGWVIGTAIEEIISQLRPVHRIKRMLGLSKSRQEEVKDGGLPGGTDPGTCQDV